MTLSTRAALVVVRAYQLVLGPFMGGTCRFEPTCSAYAIDVIAIHGARQGTWLALKRVGRCHPFGGAAGFDPAPPLSPSAQGRARR